MSGRAVAAALLSVGLALPQPAAAQSYRTLTLARQLQGEDDLRVEVEFAAGRLALAPGNASALYRARVVYDEDRVTPVTSYDARSRRLHIEVGKGRLADGEWKGHELDLALSPAVPIRLDVAFGAAQAALDLGGLAVTRAAFRTGASETTVDFSQPNRATCERLEIKAGAAKLDVRGLGNSRCRRIEVAGGVGQLTLDFTGEWNADAPMRASVKLGLGDLTLRLPAEVGVSVDLTRLLVGFERPGLTKRGSRYYSENYDSASARLYLDIDAAFGDIKVEWVP